MNEKIGEYELAATAAEEEWGLYYSFEKQEYQIFSGGLTVPLDRHYSGHQYPKAPAGRWKWNPKVWNRIIGTAPTTRQKKNRPSSSIIDNNLCLECQTEVRNLDHFHTIRLDTGSIASICCPCAKVGGYTCRLR